MPFTPESGGELLDDTETEFGGVELERASRAERVVVEGMEQIVVAGGG